ncbi:hypothetical protein K466DRAFT_654864 [Polyporus arcularius HHB13444]|uniref:F-box domain-containing protein n=1 Tax=Polyporus arcularius HHB13444 TaxID=1314778 RepID=A0A5C3P5A1_9APHY|nr:hypothetical protein K466DRAFT_654864 [Polyporus arcularius HHB13444]
MESDNRTMDIHELPAEILAIIFNHAVVSERQSSFCVEFSGAETVEICSLIAISHVCSRWRDIALSIPFLWSRVDTTNKSMLKTFQERSGEAPLSLIVNAVYVRSNPVHRCRDLLVACSSRLRRLDLALGNEQFRDVDKLLRFDAPALECLVVSHPHWWDDSELSFSDRPRQMKRLRALAFTPLTSWRPQTPLPSLTHIYLSFQPHGYRPPIVHRLVSLMAGTPALEHLHLSRLPASAPALQRSHSVPLIHLKSLNLTNQSDLRSATALITILAIQETVLIRLDCHGGDFVANPLLPPLPYLNSMEGPTRLDVGSGFRMLYLLAQGGQAPSRLLVRTCCGRFYGHFNGNGAIRYEWESLLTCFATTYSFSCVVHSRLYIDSAGSAAFIHFLHHLPLLKELELLLYLNSDVLRYGVAAIDGLTRMCRALSDESSVLCPRLHTLRVQIISATSSSPAYIGELKRMLLARTCMGYPISSLAVQVIDVASIDKSKLKDWKSTTVQRRSSEDANATGARTDVDPDLSEAYADQLASLVDEFRFYAPEESPFPPRETGELWRVPGAEDYWTLPEHDEPISAFPWVY